MGGAGDAARHGQVLDGRPADVAEGGGTLCLRVGDVDMELL